MKKNIYLLLFPLLFSLELKSQFFTSKKVPFILSAQLKSENLGIVELGFINLKNRKINWQIKTGYGKYFLNSSTQYRFYQSRINSYDISVKEWGSTIFLKPGILFHLTNKERSKRRVILAAFNIHNGLSFNEQNVQFTDAVFGEISERRKEVNFNCAAELEIIQMFEIDDQLGVRLGLHGGWKLFNPQPFEEVFSEQGKYRDYYTPALGKGQFYYLNLSLGIAYRL